MSLYLPDAKALFLHIPRTGGTWFESAMPKIGIETKYWRSWLSTSRHNHQLAANHCLLSHYHPTELLNVERVFCFVRHPQAYYESVWKWLGVGRLRSWWRWHPFAAAKQLYTPDFNEWVLLMIEQQPAWYTRLLLSYIGPNGGEHCFFVGRQERLVNDTASVLKKLGYKLTRRQRKTLRQIGLVNNITRRVNWQPRVLRRMLATERLVEERFYGGQFRRVFYAPFNKWAR
jgi:hypothetical protein